MEPYSIQKEGNTKDEWGSDFERACNCSVDKHVFCIAVNGWNKLPEDVIGVESLGEFNGRQDNV